MAEGDTWINALIGAVVTVMTGGFIPFAPILGGGVAGYLQGGDRSDGLRVGTASGAIAMIPFLLVFFFFASLVGGLGFGIGMFGGGGMPAFGFGLGAVIFLFVLVFAAVYVVGLSALGGWLGNYVKHDTDVDI